MRDPKKPTLLMCPPEHYGVEYVINPWMETGRERILLDEASRQWDALHATLSNVLDVDIVMVPAQAGLPDMVFTANAGLVLDGTFVPSRFRYQERAGEEEHFTEWAKRAGFRVIRLPDGLYFEGAGDALLDRSRPVLWMGHGFRTDAGAAQALDQLLEPIGWRTEPLRLVDDRFYHLDTCFCPLTSGYTLYYPPAFAPESLAVIERVIPEGQRILVEDADALAFACNAVNVGQSIVLNAASAELRRRLEGLGYTVAETPLSQFLCAGGASKCLTLRLDEPQPFPRG